MCDIVIGQRFGSLTVIAKSPKTDDKKRTFWLLQCDCGSNKIIEILTSKLNARRKTHCGCLRGSKDPYRRTYNSWQGMLQRCKENKEGYEHIEVCKRWKHSFSNFLEDMGLRPANTSIDRINNYGHYGPDNCRWATSSQQSSNTHVFKMTIDFIITVHYLHTERRLSKVEIAKILKTTDTTISRALKKYKGV